ncbi:hypothetical protein FOL47_001440 [Perkinsus chesapeaki]|uniref:TLDc domain-containing protein n=1 Tax=Perkinsus chesapeaki TaxID=330153 RepID=A0A7J6MIZ2_PERCH|nr:hypothetical protein FOL47_001440 [Perkinsus chesapeaki]
MATDEAVQVGTPQAIIEESGNLNEGAGLAHTSIFLREHAWFCTPNVKAPGLLTISESASTLHFEPDPRFERVRTEGMGAYQVYIDLRDLVECGAVTVPTDELDSDQMPKGAFGHYGEVDPDEYAAHFLQLQLTTLHGRRKHRVASEGVSDRSDAGSPGETKARQQRQQRETPPTPDDNVVVFQGFFIENLDCLRVEHFGVSQYYVPVIMRTQFPSREKLYKVAHGLIDIIDDITEARRVDGGPAELSTLTEVPFSCSAVVDELAKMGLGDEESGMNGNEQKGGDKGDVKGRPGMPTVSSRVSVVPISELQGSSEDEVDEATAPLLTIPIDDESAKQYIQNHLEVKDPWLLTRKAAATLSEHLPIMLRFTQWVLSYSPKVHGISLDNFYRHMERMPCPSILLIKDTEGTVFGALCMSQWRKSGKFCGNGESWVFTFGKHGYEKGNVTVYPWSSKNEFFQYGDEGRLVIGGGGKGGSSAICIYDSWLRGSTGHCLTYNSDPLASSEDFIIQDVEVWSLTTPDDD